MRNMKFVKRIGAAALAACMVLSCVGCGSSSNKGAAEGTTEVAAEGGQTKISVAAAASLQATFDDELIPLFEKVNPGVTVEGTYASSGDLQQQIESGLDADVFFSAATSNMDTLVDENLVDKDTVVDLLKNDVVLITPKDSKLGIKGFKDITKTDTIAIGDPESVPAGKYAKEILTNLGVYDEVEKKASLGASVTEVLSWVAEGSADAGIVYATDAASVADKVDIIAEAPAGSLETPVLYPVGLTEDAEASESEAAAADAFLAYLQTDDALKVFEEYGFAPYTAEETADDAEAEATEEATEEAAN